jgi:hypothetical protein
MAAPAVTGVVALMLAEAQLRGINLTAEKIHEILIVTTCHNPPFGDGWDSRFGHGRVNAAEAVAKVFEFSLTRKLQQAQYQEAKLSVAAGRAIKKVSKSVSKRRNNKTEAQENARKRS